MGVERVVSGFQSGADLGGILAAVAVGLPTGGWMPAGFKTESGPKPEYATLYGARETPSGEFPQRTEWNVRDSDATLWFGDPTSLGGIATMRAVERYDRPWLVVSRATGLTVRDVANWVAGAGSGTVRTLNVAGHRESLFPGIQERVRAFLLDVFAALGHAVPTARDRG